MRLLNKVLARRAWVPSDGTADLARARRDTLSEAAVTLAATGPDVTVDPLLHVAAEAAARITGAATAIVLTRDGLVDRFVAHGLDDGRADGLNPVPNPLEFMLEVSRGDLREALDDAHRGG